jgi:hypothetical protein
MSKELELKLCNTCFCLYRAHEPVMHMECYQALVQMGARDAKQKGKERINE